MPAIQALKKQSKKFASIGFNPINWAMEALTVYVRKNRSKMGATSIPSHQTSTATITLPANAQNVAIQSVLTKYGVCILTDFADNQQALNAGDEITQFYTSDKCSKPYHSKIKEHGEEQSYIWQTDYAWSDNYIEVASSPKAVINIRARDSDADDAGMVDIFSVEKLARNESLPKLQQIIDISSSDKVESLMTGISGYAKRQYNLYINHAITRTRGPHIDNNSAPYKLFVYLTDVTEEHQGPYCYLPASHQNRKWMSFERLRNAVMNLPSTEVSSIERADLLKLYGKAGTAIITSQSGIHCGWPQTEQGKRVLLISNYY